MEMVAVATVYAGLVAMFAGAVCVVKPLRFLRRLTRKAGLALFASGAAVFFCGALLPAEVTRATARESRLDEWMPEWQFSEFHSKRVHATPERAYRAIREVTADEILLFRTLTWIRHPRWPGRDEESILNPQAQKPVLEAAMAGGFRLLAEEAPQEIVLGTLVVWDGVTRPSEQNTAKERMKLLLSRPGNAVATINFAVRDEGGGWCTVTTETRVFATSDGARRRFAAYWRVIYPGSSLLRYTWMRAIRQRAEK